jgi:chromosome segregation ATPase
LKLKENECNEDKTKAENSFLKKRSEELSCEVDEYKVLNQELSEQLDLYRSKFLKAQEKAEEQKLRLENLEENNRLIEQKVNEEICRIQKKFQEKLQELCPYPKKLEEAKKELKDSTCQVEKLENDLKVTIAELCKAKTQLKKLQENPDEKLEQKNQKLLTEIEQLKQKHCSLKNTKECLEEKLKCMNLELENLRQESVKIITTTKQCSNRNRDILHEHIDCLEAELSKSRASAALALQEKECTIQKMQQQLQELCNKFGDAQAQIRELKNHVTCLSKKKHSVCQEDFNRIDYCG